MGKRLFLLLFAGVMGMMSSSEFLTAADDVTTNGPEFHAVETVPLPEPEPEPVKSVVVSTVARTVTPAAPQTINYTVTAYVGSEQEYVNSVSSLSYSNIYRYQKMVYGHNSANLLGNLSSLGVGQVFTITEGGVVQGYQVAAKVTYQRTADGFLNNDPYLMWNIAEKAMGHDVALMTCAGTPDGHGGASHRLVIYADKI